MDSKYSTWRADGDNERLAARRGADAFTLNHHSHAPRCSFFLSLNLFGNGLRLAKIILEGTRCTGREVIPNPRTKMAESVDYKTSKEAFVSGMTGSSVGHVNMVSLAALVYVGFVCVYNGVLTLCRHR